MLTDEMLGIGETSSNNLPGVDLVGVMRKDVADELSLDVLGFGKSSGLLILRVEAKSDTSNC